MTGGSSLAGVAVVTALTLLVVAPALAQGPMGPSGGSMMRRPAGTGEPAKAPAPERPKPAETPKAPETIGQPMGHPAAPPPFYREWTFLVLIGVAGSAAGFAVYRVARSRWRRRRGPAGFLTEAVLVVDLVDSTRLATHYGDGLAMKARTALKDRTLAAAEAHGLVFAENTGDGYFMTFPSVVGAVETAVALLKDLRDRPPDLSPGPSLEARAGISYGEILLDARGVRHGAVINKAHRLEGLTREAFASVEGGVVPEAIPDRNRIFLDEEAAQEARAAGIPLRVVGFCSLKGFSGLHRAYEVLWET